MPRSFYDIGPRLRSLSQVRVKCSPDDTVGDLKKLIAAQTGTDATKIILKKWYANITSTFA